SIPAGSTLSEFSGAFGELGLSPSAESLQKLLESTDAKPVQKQIDRARWDSVRAGETPGYVLLRYDPETKRFQADDGTVVENPDFLVLEDSPLRFYPATVPPECHNA